MRTKLLIGALFCGLLMFAGCEQKGSEKTTAKEGETKEAACCSNDKEMKEGCCAEYKENPNVKKIILAKNTIKPEKVEEFLKEAKTIIAASNAEEGCISYTLYQDPYQSNVFIFVEEWKNQAAIDAHFAEEHFKAFGALTEDMKEKPMELKIYDAPFEK